MSMTVFKPSATPRMDFMDSLFDAFSFPEK